ncbi:MAG: biotin synthase BioB [Thermodesulfovibrionales bacterium]
MTMRLSEDFHAKEMVSVNGVLDLLECYSPFDLFNQALRIKRQHSGDAVDLCSIVNAKSGACPEDCSYCAQSSRSKADIEVYPLLDEDVILEKAREASRDHVKRFCIVTSGKTASKDDLKKISGMVGKVRDLGLLPCATLGLLDEDDLKLLKDSGLERFHHNLETSERFFPSICSTHTYADKLRTIEAVKRTGLSLCSGGIFGMGETWHDRIDMALALKDIGADSVPINYLTPVDGTPLAGMNTLDPMEALSIISIYRIILPECQIRVCGGRVQTLGELHPLVFLAGADGLLTGNYLTTTGKDCTDDVDIIKKLGFSID